MSCNLFINTAIVSSTASKTKKMFTKKKINTMPYDYYTALVKIAFFNKI